MANERVSQLQEIVATEISPDDLFLLTDISARESKKLEASQLILYVEASASFNADLADTASYILGSKVDGAVRSSSYASGSSTSSYSQFAVNATNAVTATLALTASSIVSVVTADTASFLRFNPTGSNGTASFAISSALAQGATNALNLVYTGVGNGTASYAVMASQSLSSSFATTSQTSSLTNTAISSSFTTTASYATASTHADTASFVQGFSNLVKAWANVTWSVGAALPALYQNSNISDFRFLNTVTSSASSDFYFNFGVLFTTAVGSNTYTLLGDAYRPFANQERVGVIMHPIYSNRTTTGFTMSIAITGSISSSWFSRSSGSFPTDEYPYANFMILGI